MSFSFFEDIDTNNEVTSEICSSFTTSCIDKDMTKNTSYTFSKIDTSLMIKIYLFILTTSKTLTSSWTFNKTI